MCFVVAGEVLLAARDRNAAVRTFVADVCGWHRARLASLGILRRLRAACGLMCRMWAVRVLADGCCSLADDWRGGGGEGMEEVVRREQSSCMAILLRHVNASGSGGKGDKGVGWVWVWLSTGLHLWLSLDAGLVQLSS